jgi:parallel beta-helix repeat protein
MQSTIRTQFTSNEISYGNPANLPQDFDAGGTKFNASDDMCFFSNYMHDNTGTGIWFDGFNNNNQIKANLVVNNNGVGIHYELSKSATISDNVVRKSNLYGIHITNSENVTVSKNLVDDNNTGVRIFAGCRPDTNMALKNVVVRENTIKQYKSGNGSNGSASEFQAATGNGTNICSQWTVTREDVYTTQGNTFLLNVYTLGTPTNPVTQPFNFRQTKMTLTQ